MLERELLQLPVGLIEAEPVRDGRGQTIAALNCGMPFRVEARAHALKKVLPALRNGARNIERSLLTGAGGVAATAAALP